MIKIQKVTEQHTHNDFSLCVLKREELKESDYIIVEHPGHLTMQAIANIGELVKTKLDHKKVLVLTEGVKLTILSDGSSISISK